MSILNFTIRILSAATWHLSAVRSRRQCEADHREANQLGRRNLSLYTRAELLNTLEAIVRPAIEAKARENKKRKPESVPQISAEQKTIRRDGKRAEELDRLACPRCFAQFGAPANWPPTICPSCKRETLKPQTSSQHDARRRRPKAHGRNGNHAGKLKVRFEPEVSFVVPVKNAAGLSVAPAVEAEATLTPPSEQTQPDSQPGGLPHE
jgi:predicted Zn-ribbon and HTH transcriptional regulator